MKRKSPHFVEYANEREKFAERDPAALAWARRLSGLTHKSASGSTWTEEEAWEQLRGHQEEFQRLLEALIVGRPTQAQMQVLTDHLTHVQPRRRWDRSPDQVREQAAARYSEPGSWQPLRQALIAKGHGDIEDAPPQRPPLARYIQSVNAQDPLDALYVELDQFLTTEGLSRLRQCTPCKRYFVQRTARVQCYCSTACRLKANRTRHARNTEYQRRHRDGIILKDLRKIEEAKKQLRMQPDAVLEVDEVLAVVHLTKRRWNTLARWEMAEHGHPQITDLNS